MTSKKFDSDNFSLYSYGKKIYDDISLNYPESKIDALLFYFNCLYFILKIYIRDFDYVKENKYFERKIKDILEELENLMVILTEKELVSEKCKRNIQNIKKKVLTYRSNNED